MQVTETQIDELTRQFTVAVPLADIERKVADPAERDWPTGEAAGIPAGQGAGRAAAQALRRVADERGRRGDDQRERAGGDQRSRPAGGDAAQGRTFGTCPNRAISNLPWRSRCCRTSRRPTMPDQPGAAGRRGRRREVEHRLLRLAEAMGEETPVRGTRPIDGTATSSISTCWVRRTLAVRPGRGPRRAHPGRPGRPVAGPWARSCMACRRARRTRCRSPSATMRAQAIWSARPGHTISDQGAPDARRRRRSTTKWPRRAALESRRAEGVDQPAAGKRTEDR